MTPPVPTQLTEYLYSRFNTFSPAPNDLPRVLSLLPCASAKPESCPTPPSSCGHLRCQPPACLCQKGPLCLGAGWEGLLLFKAHPWGPFHTWSYIMITCVRISSLLPAIWLVTLCSHHILDEALRAAGTVPGATLGRCPADSRSPESGVSSVGGPLCAEQLFKQCQPGKQPSRLQGSTAVTFRHVKPSPPAPASCPPSSGEHMASGGKWTDLS